MAILELISYPDPLLSKVCEPVQEITDEIRSLVQDMIDTMYDAPGVGLAAPQVGRLLRIFVMDASSSEEESKLRVLINPELELLGELCNSGQEGCLSVPFGYRADVKRHESVRLRAMDLEGNSIDEILTDFEAIVAQHEFDHLNGKLFIDHISRLRRTMFEGKVKKALRRAE